MKEDKLIQVMNNILLNKIETQVILQLLIDKNIVTKEEIQNKRDYILNQKIYKNYFDQLQDEENKIIENKKFENEFKNMLNEKEYDQNWLINELNKS